MGSGFEFGESGPKGSFQTTISVLVFALCLGTFISVFLVHTVKCWMHEDTGLAIDFLLIGPSSLGTSCVYRAKVPE